MTKKRGRKSTFCSPKCERWGAVTPLFSHVRALKTYNNSSHLTLVRELLDSVFFSLQLCPILASVEGEHTK